MFKLTIVTTPPDATVLLDGERLGRTPLTIERPAGDGIAVLRLRHRGYQSRRIEIKRNQSLSLEIKLRPEPADDGEVEGDTGTIPVEPAP